MNERRNGKAAPLPKNIRLGSVGANTIPTTFEYGRLKALEEIAKPSPRGKVTEGNGSQIFFTPISGIKVNQAKSRQIKV